MLNVAFWTEQIDPLAKNLRDGRYTIPETPVRSQVALFIKPETGLCPTKGKDESGVSVQNTLCRDGI